MAKYNPLYIDVHLVSHGQVHLNRNFRLLIKESTNLSS